MNSRPEFDAYARDYDRVLGQTIPEALNEDEHFAEYKVALMAAKLKDARPRRILDFGCGAGRSLPFLDKHFPDTELWGYDVSPASLEVAAARLPRARLFSDWASLGDDRFDAIIAANVYHHIPPAQRLSELVRCRAALRPQGSFFLFEHNPLNPATRWIFERCPFDADAEMFGLGTARRLCREAGFASERHGYTLFFPRPLGFLRGLERWMGWLPLGAQYYVQMAR
ncbi:MAG TPA: class I SAM-dependent methyltransferase [Ramlibacter sp.]|uniref:class I SAM-dependent methyltransferase n=1 Tax=Ramlibacter sp. TaxID=1917967 RepID=UPI002D80EBBE|nr:class I SAM-dependent methyltransferase [Ramlibacter sp.]HET8744044.1 class I SAM-dependent methyltransferase [Ramlibacter sp.]